MQSPSASRRRGNSGSRGAAFLETHHSEKAQRDRSWSTRARCGFLLPCPSEPASCVRRYGHGLRGPVRLKDEIRLLLRQVSFYHAFLVDTWNAVAITKGRCKVLEDPLSGSTEPFESLLGFEVPVEKVAGISLRPVDIF